MSVKEIVMEYLKAHGYDGLYSEYECACLLHDLMPCGNVGGECAPGYMRDAPEDSEFDWLLGPEKKEDRCPECEKPLTDGCCNTRECLFYRHRIVDGHTVPRDAQQERPDKEDDMRGGVEDANKQAGCQPDDALTPEQVKEQAAQTFQAGRQAAYRLDVVNAHRARLCGVLQALVKLGSLNEGSLSMIRTVLEEDEQLGRLPQAALADADAHAELRDCRADARQLAGERSKFRNKLATATRELAALRLELDDIGMVLDNANGTVAGYKAESEYGRQIENLCS